MLTMAFEPPASGLSEGTRTNPVTFQRSPADEDWGCQ